MRMQYTHRRVVNLSIQYLINHSTVQSQISQHKSRVRMPDEVGTREILFLYRVDGAGSLIIA